MNDHIKVFEVDGKETKNLKFAAAYLTWKTGVDHWVATTYFDYGQDWRWTTILYDGNPYGRVQAICPRQQEMIVHANSAEEIIAGVDWHYEK